MCGIAGVAGPAAALRAAAAEELVRPLHHRGPDAAAARTFGPCALGHTRLRIIDLSPLADQPMANEDGTVWAVFNGEIYNFPELRAELRNAGHRFRSGSDTEVLVHLYEDRGPDLVMALRGMFAFALWDERRRLLLLARDRLGIKPLYYRVEGGRLSFASEVRALARHSDRVDPAALAGFLRLGWIGGPRTILAGVSELLPGQRLVWEGGRASVDTWWSPSPEDHAGACRAGRPGGLREVLADAVARHLVADVPVGLFLSAGVDSTAIARLAAGLSSDVVTYTVGFATDDDEAPEAAALARRLKLRHRLVRVGEQDALASVDRFLADVDQPTVDGLNTWLISRAVRQAGAVVALSGLGGDELFAGYSTFRHVPRLVTAARVARHLGPLPGAAAGMLGWPAATASWRGRRAVEAAAAGGWAGAYAAVRGLFGTAELSRLWPAADQWADDDVVRLPAGTGDGTGDKAAVGTLELANYLPFQLLRDTDVMSMAHSLEVRVPLLDDEVVRLVLQSGGPGAAWDKAGLLAAVDPSLVHLAHQPKRTFTLPVDSWLRGRLLPVAEDALTALGEAGLGFDRRALTDLWHGFLAGRAGWRPVWALTVLGRWLQDRPLAAAGGMEAAGR